MGPSLWHILLLGGIFVILFMGPGRLPGLGKSLGEAIRGFKKGLNDDEIDVTDTLPPNNPNQRISGKTTRARTQRSTTARTGAPRKKKVKQPVAEVAPEQEDEGDEV
jgi:sec-independent protein translocase protein TatA